jgi:putative phosphotransacetylase
MTDTDIKRIVTLGVLKRCTADSNYIIPVAVSNRHIHLSHDVLDILFGKGYVLKQSKPLSQPGQYACEEKLTLIGSKGKIEGIRILGPVRPETQVEISVTDSFLLGIKPVIRMSGDLKDTPGGILIGPKGEYKLQSGVIVSKSHLHASAEQAVWYGLKDGDTISVRKKGARTVIFEDVLVRSGNTHSLEMHIDTDEANAAMIGNGDLLEIIR